MSGRAPAPSRTVLTAWVAAFTAIPAGLVPSAVLAARSGNTFVVAVCVGGALLLVLLDGMAIGLMRRARKALPQRA